VSILDVGGGTGLILKRVEAHLRAGGIAVRKTLLDLSPQALEMQRRNHPDACAAVAGSIAVTGFGDRQFDLVQMIDVLEHVPQPEQALAEVKRISRYALLKVPLEDNLTLKLLNLATLGSFRRRVTLGTLGHVNCYSARTLREQLERAGARVLEFRFANAHDYLLHTPEECRSLAHRLVFACGAALFRWSPALAARVFNDFAVCLVEF
jgi:SAM-dependent methyltransferase